MNIKLDLNIWLESVKLVAEKFASDKELQYKNVVTGASAWQSLTKTEANFIWVIENNIDIRYKPEIPKPQKEFWMNLYHNTRNNTIQYSILFSTEENARQNIYEISNTKHISTSKVVLQTPN